MTQLLRVGLVGTSGVADRFLVPSLRATVGAQLWSVLSRDGSRAHEFAQRHQAASPTPAHTDIEAFMSDPQLDAVIIASADGLHAEQCLAAARHGKHVFVEKPMATSFADATAMRAACADAGVKLAVGYHLRWHAGHRAAAKLIHSGALGDVERARLQWTFKLPSSDWRNQNAAGRWLSLAATGTHLLDACLWFLQPVCGEIVDVSRTITAAEDGARRDSSALLTLTFANGACAEVFCSVTEKAPRLVEIAGARGVLRLEDTLGPHGKGVLRLNGEEVAFDPVDPYSCEIADFIDAIRARREPEVGADIGWLNVAMLERVTGDTT